VVAWFLGSDAGKGMTLAPAEPLKGKKSESLIDTPRTFEGYGVLGPRLRVKDFRFLTLILKPDPGLITVD